ncbi:MAG: hypothetical protein M1358_09305 [Chloroflexi bacterium]|nr:hypothetical protein [Chloroflexota bacterium]
MENFVRRLFTDADFRAEFLSSPARAIANSGLSTHERDAATRVSPGLVAALSTPNGTQMRVEPLIWS